MSGHCNHDSHTHTVNDPLLSLQTTITDYIKESL